MHFSTLSSAAALLALNTVLVTSSPIAPCADHANNNQSVTARGCNADQVATTNAPDTERFRLKAVVRLEPEEITKRFDGKFVEMYHTGSGEADLVLGEGQGALFSLSNTQLMWEIYDGIHIANSEQNPEDGDQIPVNVVYEPYAGWEPVHASARRNDGQVVSFFHPTFNTLQMRWNAGELYGFRVCDWSHGVPQVFANAAPEIPSPNNGYFNTTVTTCADVDIVRVEKTSF